MQIEGWLSTIIGESAVLDFFHADNVNLTVGAILLQLGETKVQLGESINGKILVIKRLLDNERKNKKGENEIKRNSFFQVN